MVVVAILIILMLVVLFYIWKWLYGSSDMKDMVIYSSPSDGLPAKDKKSTVFSGYKVPQIYGGGEYSISTWIYVTNWGINKGKNKPLLVLSGGSPE